MKRWYVYRFLNCKGKTLYVGRTVDLYRRVKGHMMDNRIKDIEKVQYMEFDNEEEQIVAEILYINEFNPAFNRYSKNKDVTPFVNPEKKSWIEAEKDDFKRFKKISRKKDKENQIKKGFVTITITLPKSLADKVDKKAKKELRSRSGQIANIIKTHFDDKELVKMKDGDQR